MHQLIKCIVSIFATRQHIATYLVQAWKMKRCNSCNPCMGCLHLQIANVRKEKTRKTSLVSLRSLLICAVLEHPPLALAGRPECRAESKMRQIK